MDSNYISKRHNINLQQIRRFEKEVGERMAKLSKDDPVYYKAAIRDLIRQAIDNGVEVYSSFPTHEELVFKGSNGDVASINLLMIKNRGD